MSAEFCTLCEELTSTRRLVAWSGKTSGMTGYICADCIWLAAECLYDNGYEEESG